MKIVIMLGILMLFVIVIAVGVSRAPPPNYPYKITTEDGKYILDLKQQIGFNIAAYEKLDEWLRNRDKDDVVIVRFSVNMGGSVDVAQLIMNALDVTKAQTIAEIRGSASSAAAYITCHARQLIMYPNSTLMFHRGYIYDPGEQMDAGETLGTIYALQACKNLGILTDEDINKIADGEQLYILPLIDKKGGLTFKSVSSKPIKRDHETGQVLEDKKRENTLLNRRVRS